MRTQRFVRLLVVAPLAVLAAACNLIFGIEQGSPRGSGGGGAPTATVTTSGGAMNDAGDAGDAMDDASDMGDASDAGDMSDASDASDATSDAGLVSLQDCVLLLHMDEASWSGAGAVKDSSGHGNHGTVVGSPVPVSSGKLGGAALFDGNGYIDVPSSASLQATNELTYSAWVYPTNLAGGDAGFAPGVLSKRLGFGMNVAFTLFFYDQDHAFADLQQTRINTNATFTNATWHHLAVVYEGGAADPNTRLRIYVDGQLDVAANADAPPLSPNSEDLHIGDLPGGGNMFSGMIDEVAVWTRALGAAEIENLYEGKGFM